MSAPGTPHDPPPPPAAPPASAPYGPQTAQVRRFLQRFAALSTAEWDAAARHYAELAGSAAGVAADRDLQRAVERAARTAERDAVLGPLAQLVRVEPGAAPSENGDAPAELHPVAEAALAALLALVTRDVLPARAFATLYAPFAEQIPVPVLDA